MSNINIEDATQQNNSGSNETNSPFFGKDSTVPSLPFIEIKKLPSNFLAYPKEAKVFYRPYTYRELDIFNDSQVSALENLRFVSQGIHTTNMEKEELTLSDFLYLGLLRKISSLGSTKFSVTAQILQEETEVTKILDFDDIQFQELEVPELPVVITLNQKELHFKPLTLSGYFALLQKDEELGKNERALLASECINLEFDKALSIIDNAIGEELVVIRKVDVLLWHGVLPVSLAYTTTDKKEQHISVEIDDPLSLVWPFRDNKELEDDSIRFGL